MKNKNKTEVELQFINEVTQEIIKIMLNNKKRVKLQKYVKLENCVKL